MRIDVLTFEGCPNAHAAVELVNGVVNELHVDADVREIRVESAEEAERLRFLGSPTVRVDGHDVEPGAGERADYALACRVYQTPAGTAGVPDRDWIMQAATSSR
jgi:hypothetical protein